MTHQHTEARNHFP